MGVVGGTHWTSGKHWLTTAGRAQMHRVWADASRYPRCSLEDREERLGLSKSAILKWLRVLEGFGVLSRIPSHRGRKSRSGVVVHLPLAIITEAARG